jgi:preprotein translocase subunit SecB
MSDNEQQAAASTPTPPLLLNTQYVKEVSFRVPGAPAIYASLPERPHVVLSLDVLVRPIGEGQSQPVFEVTLTMKCEAAVTAPQEGAPPPAIAYQIELGYAGIFNLANVPQNAIEPVLLAECPRLLFPFARSMLADITREAGFPPLFLQPIDFIAFWQSKRQQNAQAATGAASGPTA